MSDMATSCPHCDSETVATGEFNTTDATAALTRNRGSDVLTMSLVLFALAGAAWGIMKIAAL
jgi:hypothetical protein